MEYAPQFLLQWIACRYSLPQVATFSQYSSFVYITLVSSQELDVDAVAAEAMGDEIDRDI